MTELATNPIIAPPIRLARYERPRKLTRLGIPSVVMIDASGQRCCALIGSDTATYDNARLDLMAQIRNLPDLAAYKAVALDVCRRGFKL